MKIYKNKILLNTLIILLILILNCGCTNHSNLTKYNDNLYELTYRDYNDEEVIKINKKTSNSNNPNNSDNELIYTKSHIGSILYTNNIYGRSYDNIYNNNVEFIIRTKKTKNRYSSISINGGLEELNTNLLNKELSNEIYNILPYLVLDGINEKGVFVSLLTIPSNNNYPTTNKKTNLLINQLIPKYVLDNCKSSKDAIDKLSKKNIYNQDIFDINKNNLDFQYIIGDSKNQYVVQFINNEMVYTKSNIVTNYSLLNNNNDENNNDNKNNIGIERYNLINNNINNIKDIYDTLNLLEKLKYSNSTNTLNEEFWYSEHLGIYNNNYYNNDNIKSIKDDLFKIIIDNNINTNYKTIYASSYDLNNKRLSISLSEDYETIYQFYLTILY